MSGLSKKDYAQFDTVFIREVNYMEEEANPQEEVEEELECALEAGCKTIVIEHVAIGEATSRWISIGNCLQKTALITGVGYIFSALMWTNPPTLYVTLAGASHITTCIYTVMWQSDPCCQYQVLSNRQKALVLHPLHPFLTSFKEGKPVVLVRKDDHWQKLGYNIVTVTSVLFSVFKFFKGCTK